MAPGDEQRRTAGTAEFLTDVLVCSLGAYGGPEAHVGVFLNRLVEKKRYLSEKDLIELVALCGILPGPSSTQTITAVGYRMGGPRLAFLTLLVWALPVIVVMTLVSFLYGFLSARNISNEFLKYIGPMAVGFIITAAVKIGRKVVTGMETVALAFAGALGAYFFHAPWVYPLLLFSGGLFAVLRSPERDKLNRVRLSPPWRYLVLFGFFAGAGLAAAALTNDRFSILFEGFYRYGYLVFGGGQVVVPLMQGELVDFRGYMTNPEFLTGYGLVQGLPGPMFSFAAYAGGMAARDLGTAYQIAGAAAGGVGIFLPGTLLIFFVIPVWEDLKGIRAIRIALGGINAVAAGLLAAAALRLMQSSGFHADTAAVTAVSAALLFFTKMPPTGLVALTLAAGVFL
jgi:chromate transporter